MGGLVLLGLLVACCGLPLLWAAGASLAKKMGDPPVLSGDRRAIEPRTARLPDLPLHQLPLEAKPGRSESPLG